MRGHVAKKGRRYYPVVSIKDEDGKRRLKWHPGHDRKKDAEDALNDIVGRINRRQYVDPKRVSLSEYLGTWLEGREGDLRPSTLSTYRMYVERHVRKQLGSRLLQNVERPHVRAFYSDLRRQGLSGRSIVQIHAILRKAFQDAVEDGLLTRNPAEGTRPKAGSGHEMKVWDGPTLRLFLEATRDHRFYPAWLVAAMTGLRRGEVLGLRWKDIDLDGARLSVRQSMLAVKHEIVFSEPKTPKSRRSVSLDPESVSVLRAWRRRQIEERLNFGPDYRETGTGLAFTEKDGSPVHPDRLSKAFDKAVRAAGVPRIRLHDLRHTHASLLLAANVHAKVVSERLGHSTIMLTLDTYSHVIPALEEEAATKAASLVWG